jgi:putative peptidoglycan lipid II flippase
MNKLISPIAKIASRLWSRPIFKDTVTITICTILGRSIGFFIPFLIAAWYGVGSETDAFFFAYGIIFFLTFIFASVIGSVIMPFIAEARGNNEDIGKFVGSLLVLSFLLMLILSLAFALTGPTFLKLTTGFDERQLKLVYLLCLETLPVGLFVVWASLLSGVLNSYQAFAKPLISMGVRSLVIILFIFLLKDFLGIHAIPAAYIVGEAIRSIYLYFLMPVLLKSKVIWMVPDRRILGFFKAMVVMVMAMTLVGFNTIFNKTLASWLNPGSVSILEYANRIYYIPLTFMGEGLYVVLLSHWTKRIYLQGSSSLRGDVVKALKTIFWITVPTAIIFYFYRFEITALIYDRGVFPKALLPELSDIVGMYAICLVPQIACSTVIRGLLATTNISSIVKIAVLKTMLTVLCSLMFVYYWGLKGIPLSNSVVDFFGFLLAWFYLKSIVK